MEEYFAKIPLIEKSTKEYGILTKITEYIEKNHRKKITLMDIAKTLGYDYNYTSRYFHNTFNMSFTDFVNIYRLESALLLLEETDKSITCVALESGFQSIRTFNDLFKKTMSTSPMKYRKASRK